MGSRPNRNRTVQFHDDSDSENVSMDAAHHFQIEVAEWEEINRELRHHGFPTINIVHPSHVSHTEDVVVLKQEISKAMRENFIILMRDCDRRQALIQDLITTNNSLKEELERQTEISNKYESKAKDLKILLENAELQIKELSDNEAMKDGRRRNEEDRVKNTKDVIRTRYKQLEHKSKLQDEEVERLRKKVRKMTEEEEKRMLRQNQVFQEFRRKTSRAHNAVDEKLLDVIDSYETQLHQLRKELDLAKRDDDESDSTNIVDDVTIKEASANYKSLVRTYERQLKEARRTIKKMEDQNELVKLDMDSRPQIKDLRLAQHRIKKLERTLNEHNIHIPGDKPKVQEKRKYSTQVDDVEFLPLDHCRKYLKIFCDQLGVFDLDHVIPKLDKNSKAVEAYPRLEQFAKDVLEVADSTNVPKSLSRRPNKYISEKHEVWCERTWSPVIPTLELWLQELSKLKELQRSLSRLQLIVSPSHHRKMKEGATMSDIIELVDEMADQDGIVIDRDGREKPSQTHLMNIVQHFQNLFDVPNISGIFARMNDIYVRLGEVHNILRTLRDLLGLDDIAKSSAIVDAVGKLCQSQNSTTYQQLKQLLEDEDLDSIMDKLEQHEEFFSVFQDIINKVMEILVIDKLDQVVPAVRALQILAG